MTTPACTGKHSACLIDTNIQTLHTVEAPSAEITASVHMWIWGNSAILLCRASQALSGWMGNDRCFQVSPEMWDQVEDRALARSAQYRVVPEPLLGCLGLESLSCVETLQPSLKSWELKTRFSLRISLNFSPFNSPLSLDQPCSRCCWKTSYSMMLPPPCVTAGIAVVMSGALFPPHMMLRSSHSSIRPENVVCHSLRAPQVLL